MIVAPYILVSAALSLFVNSLALGRATVGLARHHARTLLTAVVSQNPIPIW